MPNVSTMVMDLHVSKVAARNLVDGVLITLGRSAFLRGPESRYSRARHPMLRKIAFIEGRNQSTRCCTPFQQGWCR